MPDQSTEQVLVNGAVRYAEEHGGMLRGVIILWDAGGISHEDLLAPSGYFPGLVRSEEAERSAQVVPVQPDQASGPAPQSEQTGRTLTPMERSILEVMATAERPLKQRAIASRMGQPMTPHFKSCCGRLRREGVLRYIPRSGYWRADRELPRPAA